MTDNIRITPGFYIIERKDVAFLRRFFVKRGAERGKRKI